ncbi:hypothetical protein UFOVP232_60 [uncultured Caudovirales phage]|uniref:Uncharacterized protein n=1 Tax=uncultured Caudovirales phage TaxID=2100421 RepID=A0A6J7WTK0_9CAUD|nr:hypothetical protein UFOVP232_60 [uncultured Caudovirales phage]
MAGAFASGFQMGGNIYNQAERNRLEQAQEERRAIEFAQAQEDRARVVGLREQEDAMRNQLIRPNMENYALAAPSQSVGLRMGAQPAAQLPEEGLVMPQMAAPAGGIGMREGASLGGLRAPAADTRQPTFNAAPTGAAAEDILGRMALIKGDTGAFRASQVAARGYRYEDAYKTATEKWNAMSDDEKGELVTKASYDTGIKGFGTWVPGKGKQAGYMNYMAPGQDPIRLSANEAKELYALTTAMEHDPMRARGEMEKVSDKVRLLASQAFEAQTKGVQASNMATHYGNVDAATAAHYASQGALTNARIEELKAQQKAREDVAVLGNQYAALTPAQQNGPQGRGLLQQINIANVKAGGQVNLGPMQKPEPEMTKAQAKSWELLQKSDMWQQLERKNDVAGMNKLLVGRGIDPGLIGLPGDAGWVAKPTTAAAAPAAAPVMQQGLYPGDEDWRSVPTRPMQQGIATLDATKLLRTPKYSANTSSPNFRD